MTEEKDPLKELLSTPGALYETPSMEEAIMASVNAEVKLQKRAAKYRRWGFWSLLVCFGLLGFCWWLSWKGQSDTAYHSPVMAYVLVSAGLLLLFAQLEIRWGKSSPQ